MPAINIPKSKIEVAYSILIAEGLAPGEIKGNSGTAFRSADGGIINIYGTGTVNFQGPQTAKENITTLFNDKCGHLCGNKGEDQSAGEGRPQNMSFSFIVPFNKRQSIGQEISLVATSSGFNIKETAGPNLLYRYTIADTAANKITVTHYATHRILIQGLRSDLWDTFVQEIATTTSTVVQTYVAQVLAPPGKEVEIRSFVQTNELQIAEQVVRERLHDAYSILTPFERGLIESSQCLLHSAIPQRDFFGFVSGTMKAMEGFVKNVVIKIGAFSSDDVASDAWDFGQVYKSRSKTLTAEVFKALSTDTTKRNRQERALRSLVEVAIYQRRHPFFHLGSKDEEPKAISDLAQAQSIQEQLLGLITMVYKAFEDELTL